MFLNAREKHKERIIWLLQKSNKKNEKEVTNSNVVAIEGLQKH